MKIIGLTGGIATGKSTASHVFRNCGVPVIDADEIARSQSRRGGEAYPRIVAAFGRDILDPQTLEIDRARLADLVFSSAPLRRKLNAATHSLVIRALLLRTLAAWFRLEPVVVLDIPLLFETKTHKFCTETMVISVDSAQRQEERLLARDPSSSVQQARARISAQLPLVDKCRLATRVIDNSGTMAELEAKIRAVVDRTTSRAARVWAWLTSPYALLVSVVLLLRLVRSTLLQVY